MSVMTKLPIIYAAAGGAGGGVLIASPSIALREQVLQRVTGRWGPVHQALGGAEALGKLEDGNWQILFLDRRLPDLESGELMAIIQQRFPEIQVVLLDSQAALPAEDAGRTEQVYPDLTAPDVSRKDEWRGAEDWSTKDKDEDRDRNRNRNKDEKEDEKEHEKEYEYEPLPGMIGRSQAMQRVYRLARPGGPPHTALVSLVQPWSG